MIREFVRLPEFERQCRHIGLDEDDIQKIENVLLLDPAIGDIITETGGLRKFRFALPDLDRGKSGGARVIYIEFAFYEKIYLVTVYAKSETENLSRAEKNELKKLVKILESELKNKEKKVKK